VSDKRQLSELSLPFTPPLAWEGLTGFLASRVIPEIERVTPGSYARTIAVGELGGAIEARLDATGRQVAVRLELPVETTPLDLAPRVRRLFDLDADSVAIGAHLQTDPDLAELVEATPGLRVPGAWDPFELTVRAILGQQVTVKGAATLGSRLVRAYGRPVSGLGDLTHLFPEPAALAGASLDEVRLPAARAATIRGLAEAVERGQVDFSASASRELRTALVALPGIGDWTAQYVAMRGAGERDAFPASDLALLRAAPAGGEELSPAGLKRRAESWRPFRAYAAMYLWRSYASRLAARRETGSRRD
jgi:AraC family transcriptional regulator of adaptative response / DNA-3-methyladenine glycosylase II